MTGVVRLKLFKGAYSIVGRQIGAASVQSKSAPDLSAQPRSGVIPLAKHS